jgi:cellulose synthase operon protein C
MLILCGIPRALGTLIGSTFARMAAIAISSALVVACGGPSRDKLMSSAQDYLRKGNPKAAVIEAKTALQQGDSADARFVLGSALLATGDVVGADVELRKARTLKHPDDDVVPVLAGAMLMLGRDKALVDELGPVSLQRSRSKAQLAAALAMAHARLGQLDRGMALADAAVAADASYIPGQLTRARILVARRDVDGALVQLESALRAAPADAEALVLKGDMLTRLKADYPGAIAAYEAAVKAEPSMLQAHSGLIAIALSRRDWEAASKHLEQLEKNKSLVDHPQVLAFRTRIALGRGDTAAAKEGADRLLKLAPKNPSVLEIVGTVEAARGNWATATAHLENALKERPELLQARLSLAGARLRTAQPARALAALQPLIDANVARADVYSMAGEALVGMQDLERAQSMFERAAKVDPKGSGGRTALALMKLGRGEDQEALLRLDEIATTDAGTSADFALVSAHLRRGDFDAALLALDRLDRKQPDKAMPAFLRGLALIGRKDLVAARAALENAIKRDENFFPAVARLSELDRSAKQTSTARERIERFLKTHAGHADATRALLVLRRAEGSKSAELIDVLARAVAANPGDAALRMQLIEHHLGDERRDLALVAAKEAATAIPDNAAIAEALGRVAILAEDRPLALAAFGKLVTLQPESTLGHLRLAELHLGAKQFDLARQSLERAAVIAPKSLEVQARRAAVELADGRKADALTIAKTMQRAAPREGDGFALEGDIHAASNQWPAAANAYRQALQVEKSSQWVGRLQAALRKGGKGAEADRVVDAWLQDRPLDTMLLHQIGAQAMATGDFQSAEKRYQAALQRRPDDAAALNNIAWARLQRGAPGALALAQQAHDLAPSSPSIMETLALALLAQGRANDALVHIERGVAAAPGHHGMRLSLAKIYVQLDRKEDARKQLEPLVRMGEKFDRSEEARKLMSSL